MYRKRMVPDDLRAYLMCAFLACLLLFSTQSAHASTLSFSFTTGADYTTSAGAYKPDGTLVRTLWRKVFYHAGAHSYTWDGKDDDGNDVPAGTYQFKIVAHNMSYVWDGAIGNTSSAQTGMSVHRNVYPAYDMAISGTKAYYVAGYNEGNYAFTAFETTNPQVATAKWRWVYNSQFDRVENQPTDIWDRSWSQTATDGTWTYFAAPQAYDPTTGVDGYKGFITASKVSDNSQAYFTNGTQIQVGPSGRPPVPNGIYVGTQAGLSGLAVQKTGDLLAASVGPDNLVYFFDKTSGAAAGTLSVTNPGKLDFAPNGDLWVTSGTTVSRYTLTASTGVWTVATTITGFEHALDVAVDPSNNNIVMIADGGASQQIKAYNSTGTSLWTYGTAGGYSSDGTVANNKFWFSNRSGEDTFIAIQSDGSFWVGDGGNNRNLHFSSSRSYIDQIAYVPTSYNAQVDRNNPTRVFNEFLEYSVDYSQPIGTGWTLVKNWGAGLSYQYYSDIGFGLKQVVTLSNGHTYATAYNFTDRKPKLVELTGNSLRFIDDLDQPSGWMTTLTQSGDLIKFPWATPTFTKRSLTGFDASFNPVWDTDASAASASNGSTDPAPRCCGAGLLLSPITSSNVIVSYDQSLNNGFHLGGISAGGTSWLWRAMPAVGSNVPIDGLGSYDIGDGVTYGGNTAVTAGRHIVAGYHGEFYRSQGQAGQFMHFYDNGLFLGQFGEPSVGHAAYEGVLPNFAGNGFSPDLVRAANGEYYLWVNDESQHGPQRWHLVGANSIREYSGSGTLGGSSVSVNPIAAAFPTDVAALAGDAQVNVSWTAVSGATSYNLKYSTSSGGPYTSVNGITGTSFVKAGLTNGTTYYFVVSAVVSGVESVNSDQVAATPFDTSVVVQTAGQQNTPSTIYPYDINSSASASGQPALNIATPGTLSITEIGRKGYKVFDYGGAGSDSTNLNAAFTVTKGAGWNDGQYHQPMKIDGVAGTDRALEPTGSGSIDITVSDTNFHYLTVFSPVTFNYSRDYTVKLTPQGASTPVAQYVQNSSLGYNGYNNIFQFRFKGNVTLTVTGDSDTIATIQAVFLDDMTYYTPTTPPAPTGLTATAGNAQAVLNWAPTSGATSYNVYRGTTAGGESSTAIATGITATTYTNTGLTNGTTYYYKIKAVNSVGTGAYSNEDSATPTSPVTVPSAPTGLTATAGDTEIELNWTASSGATSYKVFRGTSAGGESTTPIVSGVTGTTYTDTGLTNGTTYYYKIAAVNSAGTSSNSTEVSATPASVPGGTGSIGREYWTGIGGNAITDIPLSTTPSGTDTLTSLEGPTNWTDNYGDRIRGYITAPVTGSYTFWISGDDNCELWLSTDDQPGNKVGIASVPGWTPSHSWSVYTEQKSATISLTAGHNYYVEVLHKEGGGDDNVAVGWLKPGQTSMTPSEIVPGSALTPYTAPSAPSAPTGLTATAGNAQIGLSWTATSGATGYNVYRGTTAGGESTTAIASGVTGTTYTDTGLTNGTTYYYKIKAVNSVGSSGYSNEDSATPSGSSNASIAYASSAPTIDGTVDSVWSGANAYNLTTVVNGSTSVSGNWKAMWDSSKLYLLATVTDGSLVNGTADYNGDSVELYIDADNSKSSTYGSNDFQYILGWGHSTISEYAHSGTSGVTYAQTNITGGYRMEIAIPWTTLGVTPVASSLVGIDVGIDDAASTSARAGQVMWYGTDLNYQSPSLFGTGVLVAPTTPSAPTSLAATAGNAQINLSWTAASGATSYNVYRGTTAGGESTTAVATGVTGTTFADTTLPNGTTYYYKIKAVNSGGTSGYSNEANATTSSLLDAAIAHASSAPTIDGTVDSVWSGATAYDVTTVVNGSTTVSGNWKAMWDSSKLYLLATVSDGSLVNGTADYTGDSVELYVDADNSKSSTYGSNDFQYILGWGHSTISEYAHSGTSGVTYAQTNITGGYRVEIAIPWTTLGVTPTANNEVGFDVGIDDAASTSARAGQVMWYGTDLNYQSPSLFGTGKLMP